MPNHDLVFSLGPDCRNNWNLRNYFGTDRAYPFDWWITPARSMLALLERGRAFHVDRDDLSIIPTRSAGSNTVFNRRFRILHHHDFRRGPDNLVREISDEDIEKVNQRYRIRFKRLFEDIDKAERPLAVMNGVVIEGAMWETKWDWGAPADSPFVQAITPAQVIEGIQERLGKKVHVVILDIAPENIGPERHETYHNGTYLSLPAEPQPDVESGAVPAYAQPAHVFRRAYRMLDLKFVAPVSAVARG